MSNVKAYSVNDHFAGKDPALRKMYDRLITLLRRCGPLREEPKKTSIHLVNASALAGVEVRNSYLLLNLKADHKIESSRIQKTEQISARRFHHKIKLASLQDLDAELQGWLQEAYQLSGADT